MAYTTATLTGTYLKTDGTPAEGTIEIIPNSTHLVDAEGDVILAGRVKVTLDGTGSFTVDLPATDDPTIEPATGRQYTVVAKLRHTHLNAITGVELPGGTTVDVADVASLPVVDPSVTLAATPAQLAALEDTLTVQIAGKQDAGDYATTTDLATKADVTALAAKQDAATLDSATAGRINDPASATATAVATTIESNRPPREVGLTVVSHSDAGQYRPIGLNAAGELLGWYFAGGRIVKSVDDGLTWTIVNNPGATLIARGMRDLRLNADGEALVIALAAGADGESIWKSTGWASNPTTATWTQVHTLGAGLSYSYGGFSVRSNRVMLAEYGPQTNQGAGPHARRAYLSTDGGATFSQVFDLNTTTIIGEGAPWGGPTKQQHLHGIDYDPWWDRLWVCIGDAADGGVGYAGVIYSDDAGATWNLYAGSKTDDPGKLSLVPHAMPDSIVFCSDSTPNGVRIIERKGYRVGGDFGKLAHVIDEGAGIQFVGRHKWQTDATSPLLLSFTGVLSTSPGVLVGTWDGINFHTLYRDPSRVPTATANYRGLERAYGPTVNGKAVAYNNDTGRYAAGSIFSGFLPTRPSRASAVVLREKYLGPSAVVGAESVSRAGTIATTTALTSGTRHMVAVALPRGEAVSRLVVMMAAAVGAPTGWWFELYDKNRRLLARTANQGSAPISGGAIVSLPIAQTASGAATSYTPTEDGLYYIGVVVIASGATMQSANCNAAITGNSPAITGTSNTGVAAVPSFPFTAAAITAVGTIPYAYAAS